jgi:hypothetical protein
VSGEDLRDLEIETAKALLKGIRDSVPDSVPGALEQLASAYAEVVRAAPASKGMSFGTSGISKLLPNSK